MTQLQVQVEQYRIAPAAHEAAEAAVAIDRGTGPKPRHIRSVTLIAAGL